MNHVGISGYLGNDPDVRYTENNVCKTRFSIGNSWYCKSESKSLTDWVDIKISGKLAEHAGNNLSKGSHVTVSGRIKTYYKLRDDGSRDKQTYVLAKEIEFDKKPK